MNSNQHQRRHSADELHSTPPAFSQIGNGRLPRGWKSTTLGALGHTSSGGTPSRSDSRFWGGDIPWISSKDMKVARLHDSLDHVTHLALGNGTRLVQPGTILMVVRGMSLAHSFPVAIVERPVAFNQDLKAFAPIPAVDGEFLLRWLQANQTRLLLLATEATHGTKRIPTGDLLATHVSLPRLAEQREIAEAQWDVDGLLGALDTLIAKQRAIKQATMQQLLTGKTRLPGFCGDWETKRIGDTCTCLPTASNPRADLVEHGDVEYIHYGDIHACARPVLDCTRSELPRIQQSRIGNAAKLEDGDLVMVDASEDLEGIGKSVEIQGTKGRTVVAGLHTILCRSVPDQWAMGFKAYLQFIPELKSSLMRVSTGISVYAISRTQLADIKISLPPILEQEAIVSVLSDMDAGIAALERRRNKIRGIKQGMLQQLLTGQVRLAKTGETADRDEVTDSKTRKHNWQFNEAVLISVLARNFGTEQYPLGRKRYTKLSYLLHRHKESRTEGYLKKAAGPYNPRIRYGGPERIALDNGYIRRRKNRNYQGFVADSHVGEAEEYFDKWYGKEAIQWLERFRYKKNDELELLTTVDMAAEELRAADTEVSVESVKNLILGHQEWKAKIDRRIFADANLARALEDSRTLFAVRGERDTA